MALDYGGDWGPNNQYKPPSNPWGGNIGPTVMTHRRGRRGRPNRRGRPIRRNKPRTTNRGVRRQVARARQQRQGWERQQNVWERQAAQQQAQLARILRQIRNRPQPTFEVPKPAKPKPPKPTKPPKYSNRPLPLPAEALALFSERRAGATRELADARNAKQLGAGQIRGDFQQFLRDITSASEESRDQVMGEASARNLAFQPAFVNPRFREIRDERSRQTADATRLKTEGLTALQAAVDAARRNRQQVLAQNKRERARYRSQLDRLVRT